MSLYSIRKISAFIFLVSLLSGYNSLVQADNGEYYSPPPPTYNQAPPTNQYGGQPIPPNYGNNPGNSYNAPWNSNPWGYSPPNNRGYGYNGPGNNAPWNNRGWNNTPWNNGGWNNTPWNNRGWGNGGRNPFGPRNPNQWMNPNKHNMANNWDDMMNAPSRMGKMPGGWRAPSVSVPNPIDVGEEFSDAARDIPDQMNNFNN